MPSSASMAKSMLFANSRIIHKPYSGKEEYLIRLGESGKPEIEQISGVIDTKSVVHSNYSIRGSAYIGYALEPKLVGNVFNTMPLVNTAFLRYRYAFSMMVKNAELLRMAGDEPPVGNNRTPYTNEIFIDEIVATTFRIREGQMLLLKTDPLFKPVNK